MFDKILQAFIPAGCTFGPLFMTNNSGQFVRDVRWAGAVMLSIALIGIWRLVHQQKREIVALQTILKHERAATSSTIA